MIVLNGLLRLIIGLSYLLILIELLFLPIPSEASTHQLAFKSGVRPLHRFGLLLSYAAVIVFYVFPLLWAIYPAVYRLALPLTAQPAFASPVLAVVAILAILLGSAIGLAGTLELRRALIGDDGGAVVSTGVFRLSRNPIVLGLHIAAIGYLITIPSLLMAVGLIVFWRHMETRIGIEEAFLLNRHPERYRRYRRSVGRYLRWWGRAP